jgi:hypothetical protein
MMTLSRERSSVSTTDKLHQLSYERTGYAKRGHPLLLGVDISDPHGLHDGDLRRTGLVICLISMTVTAASTITMLLYMF